MFQLWEMNKHIFLLFSAGEVLMLARCLNSVTMSTIHNAVIGEGDVSVVDVASYRKVK